MINVSRETLEKLKLYKSLLHKWQKTQNLVSNLTLQHAWERHFEDSLQLIDLSPILDWVDMGSGAGFPGLVIAISAPQINMTLIESNSGKCAFLREVARQTATKVTIMNERVETVLPKLSASPKTYSARALASLDALCALIAPFYAKESIALFMKGRNLEEEMTQAIKNWDIDSENVPSKTDADAVILKITNLNQRVK